MQRPCTQSQVAKVIGRMMPAGSRHLVLNCLHLLLQKQQALLGQMLMEGYGCERDAAAGKEWSDKARRRGYRMAGVYCEL